MEIEIRQTTPDDRVALRLAEVLRDEVEAREAHNGAARPETPLAVAVRADSDTLVAYADSKPVALGALRSFGPGVAEIKRVYVLPAHRGSGVGRRILGELERRARERGFEAVRPDTNTRLREAIEMYERAGYRQIPDYNSNPRSNRRYEKASRLSFHNPRSRAFHPHGRPGPSAPRNPPTTPFAAPLAEVTDSDDV